MKDFFISYTAKDREWAEWIAWELEAAGYTIVIQAWDFKPGDNFVARMRDASRESTRTIAVLSQAYLDSLFASAEWNAAFVGDPSGAHRKLIPVRIEPVKLEGMDAAIVYLDLVGLSKEEAGKRLLSAVKADRAKPSSQPKFPGDGVTVPAFPGYPSDGGEGGGTDGSVGRRRMAVLVGVLLVLLPAAWFGISMVRDQMRARNLRLITMTPDFALWERLPMVGGTVASPIRLSIRNTDSDSIVVDTLEQRTYIAGAPREQLDEIISQNVSNEMFAGLRSYISSKTDDPLIIEQALSRFTKPEPRLIPTGPLRNGQQFRVTVSRDSVLFDTTITVSSKPFQSIVMRGLR